MVSIAIFWLSLDVGFKVILAGGIPNLSGPTLLGFDRANVNTTIPTERSQALFLKSSQPWRLKLEQVAWKIPMLSTYLKQRASYRFYSSLLRCLEASIPIVKAMEMSVATTGSEAAKAAWPRVGSMMRHQIELHTAITALGFVLPYAISQIIVGQKSGQRSFFKTLVSFCHFSISNSGAIRRIEVFLE